MISRFLWAAAWIALPLVFVQSGEAQESTAKRPVAAPKPFIYIEANKANYLKLADETDDMLRRDILGVWFPRTIDNENGGFRSQFTREWESTKSLGKFSVFQGRMTWISAQVVMHRPDLKEQYLPYVKHGIDYLNDVLWDKQYGGFYLGLDDKGQIDPLYSDAKHLYGISFGLYGASAAYQATHDPRALELAKKTFRWIDEHAHDSKNSGYFEWLTREGKIVPGNPDRVTSQGSPLAHFPIGYKSMNTHIHLLESVTQLYEVWKDDTVRQRLQELLTLVRDKVCVQPGAMNLFFTIDWRPIPDHDSYGHDIETAYLMLEAEDVLGRGHDPRTVRMAKQLVDHSLAYGWDEAHGGFYGDGITFGKPENKNKEWWVEMEGLNVLLLMHQEYGKQTDVYFKAFQKQWRFIQNYQADAQFHGIYELVGEDGVPIHELKGSIWKCAYHDGRALLNVTDRLHKLAEASPN